MLPEMKTLLRIFVAIPVLLATLWWALALSFAAPGPAVLQVALAATFALGTVALLIWLRPFLIALAVWAVALAIILFWWSTLRPSNDRDWQPDVVRLPSAEVQGNKLIVHNLRNADYRTETDYTVRYDDRAYDLSKLRGLLLEYVRSMNELVDHPQFYNALTHNCTTSIRRLVTHANPNAPPFDWRFIANGYGDELMYERGNVETRIPFAELKARGRINA